jgi:uncharacterized protein (DUF58 family)
VTWLPTPALVRTVLAGVLALGVGVVLGIPSLAVAALPFLPMAVLGLAGRPTGRPTISARIGGTLLQEGRSTVSRLEVGGDRIEHVSRAIEPAPHLRLTPVHGVRSGLPDTAPWAVRIAGGRWGRHTVGNDSVALTSPWCGFRWGPDESPGPWLTVLPSPAAYDATTGMPDPVGLVGAHRSRRQGDGTEYAATRTFALGDRLRRVNWRVSTRTGALHVDTTLTEEDTGILLLVDALADHGAAADGRSTSLDLTVRAAAALATRHLRQGDRVSLRVVGEHARTVAPGTGSRHLQRLLGTLAGVTPGERHFRADQLALGVTAGTVVLILSPMLAGSMATIAAGLRRSGVSVLVIDTLPPDTVPVAASTALADSTGLAWRIRLLERDATLARLAATGAPVVPWRGPGTLDEVLRRLARQAQLPRVRVR